MSAFIHIPARGPLDVFTLPSCWTDVNLQELMRGGAYDPPVVARQEKKPLTYHGVHTFINTLLSHPLVVVYVQQNSVNLNYKFQYAGHIHVIGNVGLVVPSELMSDIDLTELSALEVRTKMREAIRYDQEVREEALRRLVAEKREEDIRAMMLTLRSSV